MTRPADEAWVNFPLFDAIFGRRSRRFGQGMTIDRGPLAYTSAEDPVPLTWYETHVLAAMASGSVGWHEGIPHRDREPALSSYALRFGGGASPAGAGISAGELLYTNDDGIFMVRTRDAVPVPASLRGVERLDALVAQVSANTVKISARRVDVPRAAPYMHEHNFWNANVPGSTLFMPVLDLSQKMLGIMALLIQNRITIIDEKTGDTCGDLRQFHNSGLLDDRRKIPLGLLEASMLSTGSMENALMGQNIMLGIQALGLGGFLFTGIDPTSLMGGAEDPSIHGVGFRFTRDRRWLVPNPVGLDGLYEGWVPPYARDMYESAQRLADLKFSERGSYSEKIPGPYKAGVRGSATPYSDELVACLGTVAQYVYDTYARFPSTVPTMLTTPYVQAHHLDLEWYDRFLGAESYLDTHRNHHNSWHS